MESVPFLLTTPQDALPTGNFLLPVCVSRESLIELMNTLKQAKIYGEPEIVGYWAILEALAYVNDPENAPCMPPSACDEDTYSDSVIGFIDEIISNIQTGGISKAVGYVIDTLGSVIVETALKVITVTAIGVLTGGIINILIGGTSIGTVVLNADEVLDIVIDLTQYTTPTNVVEFIYEVA